MERDIQRELNSMTDAQLTELDEIAEWAKSHVQDGVGELHVAEAHVQASRDAAIFQTSESIEELRRAYDAQLRKSRTDWIKAVIGGIIGGVVAGAVLYILGMN